MEVQKWELTGKKRRMDGHVDKNENGIEKGAGSILIPFTG